MSCYVVLPVGSDRNIPRLTDAQLARLVGRVGPVNSRPYVSTVAYLAGRRHTGGAR